MLLATRCVGQPSKLVINDSIWQYDELNSTKGG